MSKPVIIVSDENKKLDLVKAALRSASFEIITVSTGYELTSVIFKYSPDLIIFTPSTQWINSFEFVKEIKNSDSGKNIKFIFLCDKITEKYISEYEENNIKCISDNYQISDFIKYIQTLI